MDNSPTARGYEDRQFKEVIGLYDAPAFMRRARQVQEAVDRLIGRCRRQRDEWLKMVRIRLGVLGGLAGDWSRLGPLLCGPDQVSALRDLHECLRPELRAPVEATSSRHALRRALRELCDSIERFNRRWRAFVQTVDLTHVNEVREGYNRYYVLEKECALRSQLVARQGFRKLEPFTVKELLAALPVLPLPKLTM
jgi:hypothetical protein